jgi:hypothetical protein
MRKWLENAGQYLLVIIGGTPEGKKGIAGLTDAFPKMRNPGTSCLA